MQTIKTIVLILASIAMIGLILKWSAKHDKEIMQAGDQYTKCIQDEYNQSPAEYYSNNGEYPECL